MHKAFCTAAHCDTATVTYGWIESLADPMGLRGVAPYLDCSQTSDDFFCFAKKQTGFRSRTNWPTLQVCKCKKEKTGLWFSASWGFDWWPLDQGIYPWTVWGFCPDCRYRLALRAHHAVSQTLALDPPMNWLWCELLIIDLSLSHRTILMD